MKYLLGILIIVVLISGCFKVPPSIKMTPPELLGPKGEIEIVGKPLLNQNFKLIHKMTSSIDVSDVKVKIILPENIELISGNLEWTGDIEKEQTIELESTLRVTKIGLYEIKSSLDITYLDVSEKDAVVSDEAPENKWSSAKMFAIPSYEREINADLEFRFTEIPELKKEVGLITKVIVNEDICKE